MLNKINGMLVAVALVCAAGQAQAVPISGLFNTGVDGSGTTLGDGASDTHYTISSGGAGIVMNNANIPGSWLPNSSTSRWIWETATGAPVNVTRIFETTFDLTGFDFASAVISGQCATDNLLLSLKLNGSSVSGADCDGFGGFTGYSINSGFQAGVNTLSFEVNDFGAISGFRNEFLSSNVEAINCIPGQTCPPTGVPLPSTLALFGLGLTGLGWSKRKKV